MPAYSSCVIRNRARHKKISAHAINQARLIRPAACVTCSAISPTLTTSSHMYTPLSLLALLAIIGGSSPLVRAWEATWESLDSRPNPTWYDESKFGIFIHWGVFSVPAFGSEWFWWWWQGSNKKPEYEEFVRKTEHENFAYADYAHRFDASLYRPEEWANLFAQSGAQYVVLTSKHHEGFCNWDSKEAVPLSWNCKFDSFWVAIWCTCIEQLLFLLTSKFFSI